MKLDMTEGTPWRQIIRFTIPLLLGNLFQQFYNMADAFIISRILGVEAFAGVSSTGGISFLILGFAQGMTSGLSIVLSQSYGAKNYEQVRVQYFHNLLLSLGVTLLLTAGSLPATGAMLRLLRTPEEIFGYAFDYLQILFAGIFASMLFNFYSNTLRALGDSRSPLIYLLIASGTNIVLDILLIAFTPLGVRGAAIATVASQGFSALLCMRRISKTMEILSLKGYREGFSMKVAAENLRLGLPMAFQSSIIAVGVIAMQFATNGMGTAAVAAYSAGAKIDGIAVEPLRSLGIAMTTYTAQNLGAKKEKRILTGIRESTLLSIGFSIFLGVFMFTCGGMLSRLFIGSGEEAIVAQSHELLCVHGVNYIILGLLFIYRFSLQGLGQTFIPTVAGAMELVMRLLAAFVLVPQLEFFGACISTPLSWLGALIPAAVSYLIVRRKLLAAAKEKDYQSDELPLTAQL